MQTGTPQIPGVSVSDGAPFFLTELLPGSLRKTPILVSLNPVLCEGHRSGVMERIEKTVFLSYRRTNIPWALAIFQNLTQHGYDVFFDYNGIASGDFERVILGNITARAHFLVLLTPSALEQLRRPGRLVAPRDRDCSGYAAQYRAADA
jgi:hypothetical protein